MCAWCDMGWDGMRVSIGTIVVKSRVIDLVVAGPARWGRTGSGGRIVIEKRAREKCAACVHMPRRPHRPL